MSKLALRTMPGIDRPALAALLPTLGENDVIMLDLGANTECDAQNLVQFAVMGAAYARTRPRHRRAAGEAAQHRHRGIEGHRRAQGCRRAAARGAIICRSASTASPRATSCRAAKSTSSSPTASPATSRLKTAEGHRAVRHRPAAPRLQELAPVEGRLRAVAAGAQPAARSTSTPTITMARSSSASTGWW